MKHILDKKIKEYVFEELIKQKENHSKVSNLQYNELEMQKYLRKCEMNIRKEEAQEIFKMRNRVSDVKINSKGNMKHLIVKFAMIKKRNRKNI